MGSCIYVVSTIYYKNNPNISKNIIETDIAIVRKDSFDSNYSDKKSFYESDSGYDGDDESI